MSWVMLLYNFLAITVVLHASAATIAAWYIFRLRDHYAKYWAWMLVGVAAEAWVAILSLGLSPRPAQPIGWIIVLRIATRIGCALTMGAFALYLLNFINGAKK